MPNAFDSAFSNAFGWNNNPSELILKNGSVGTNGYQDGDIIQTFTKDRIRRVSAQTVINNVYKELDNGFVPSGIHQDYHEATATYKFTVSGNEVIRTKLSDQSEETFSDIDIDAVVAKKKRNQDLYGNPNNQFWYSGIRPSGNMSTVWGLIELHTNYLESNYAEFPLTNAEKTGMIPITTNSLTTERSVELVESSGNYRRTHMIDYVSLGIPTGQDNRGVKYIDPDNVTSKI